MKSERPPRPSKSPLNGHAVQDEDALIEEVRQLRAAIRIYRELVEKLLRERSSGD